jgi:hypothetical protein
MQEISHLVVNGCSWTYGHELRDPKSQSWPALVAKKLDLPIVNLALGGSSNPTIFRRTAEYLFRNLPTGSKPFVILAWSQNTRNEAWDKKHNDYFGLSCLDQKNLSHGEKAYLHNWNYEDHFRRSLMCKVNMVSLLQSLNIPFIIGDYENSDNDFFREFDQRHIVKNRFQEMYNFVAKNPNVWKTSLIDFCLNTKKQPNGHEGVEGHNILGEKVFEFFNHRYKHFKRVDSKFLTMKEFTTQMGATVGDIDSDWLV